MSSLIEGSGVRPSTPLASLGIPCHPRRGEIVMLLFLQFSFPELEANEVDEILDG